MSTFCTQGDGASTATATATAGVTAALVGFAGSLAIVLAGLRAVGADPAQASWGLLALMASQNLAGITVLALHGYRPRLGPTLTCGPSGPDQREAALVTFLVTASQITALGLGAPFWGLAAGLAMVGLERLRG